jgi:hypothetical protein
VRGAGVFVLFVLVVAIEFRPGLHSVFNRIPANAGDPALIIWFLVWGGHAFIHQPLHYFDANAFWPYHSTLAYSETMAPLVPYYNAVYGLSGNWVFALNILDLSLVVFNLSMTYVLVRWLTKRTDAAVVAAVAFGINGYVVAHWGHIQLQALGFLPLSLFLLFKVLEHRRLLTAFLLGVSGSALTLSALYYGAIYGVVVPIIVGGYVIARRFKPGPGLVRCLAVAGVTMIVLVTPFAVPYARAQHQPNLRRSMSVEGALRPHDPLTPAPGSYRYPTLAAHDPPSDVEHRFFPGFTVYALALVGAGVLVAAGLRFRRRRLHPLARDDIEPEAGHRLQLIVLLLLGAVGALVLAKGPTILGIAGPYRFFYDHVPGFASTRITARFAVVDLLAGALLAGIGFAWLTHRLPVLARAAAAGLFVVLQLVEMAAPIPSGKISTASSDLAVYHELAARPSGAVLELPIEDPRADPAAWAYVEAPRMVYSTIDFKPRLNGYSGGLPPTYYDDIDALQTFPSATALARLDQRRVRYVVVHVGVENGFPAVSEAAAQDMVKALPPTATVARYGSAFLIDLKH